MRKYIFDVTLFLATIAVVAGYYIQKNLKASSNQILGLEIEAPISTPTPTLWSN